MGVGVDDPVIEGTGFCGEVCGDQEYVAGVGFEAEMIAAFEDLLHSLIGCAVYLELEDVYIIGGLDLHVATSTVCMHFGSDIESHHLAGNGHHGLEMYLLVGLRLGAGVGEEASQPHHEPLRLSESDILDDKGSIERGLLAVSPEEMVG